jgi:hypothetical protein
LENNIRVNNSGVIAYDDVLISYKQLIDTKYGIKVIIIEYLEKVIL